MSDPSTQFRLMPPRLKQELLIFFVFYLLKREQLFLRGSFLIDKDLDTDFGLFSVLVELVFGAYFNELNLFLWVFDKALLDWNFEIKRAGLLSRSRNSRHCRIRITFLFWSIADHIDREKAWAILFDRASCDNLISSLRCQISILLQFGKQDTCFLFVLELFAKVLIDSLSEGIVADTLRHFKSDKSMA